MVMSASGVAVTGLRCRAAMPSPDRQPLCCWAIKHRTTCVSKCKTGGHVSLMSSHERVVVVASAQSKTAGPASTTYYDDSLYAQALWANACQGICLPMSKLFADYNVIEPHRSPLSHSCSSTHFLEFYNSLFQIRRGSFPQSLLAKDKPFSQ